HKTGVIGAGLYLWVLGSGVAGLWHMARHAERHSPAWYVVWAAQAGLLGTLVGNLSQPNLTYSLTGNTLYLILGVLLTRHGAADLVEAPEPPAVIAKPVSLEIRNVQPGPAPT